MASSHDMHDHHAMMEATPSNVSSMHSHHMHHSPTSTTTGHSAVMSHMMSMSFHFGCNEVILFNWWRTETVWGIVGSAVIVFLMALLYEGLKYYREYLFWKTYNLLEYRPVTTPNQTANPGRGEAAPSGNRVATPTGGGRGGQRVQYVGEVIHKQPPKMISWSHLLQTLLHIIQVTLSFLLMLVFMVYNVWLCLAVVLGAGVGYFLFCWKKSVIVDVTEHCH